jgi:hypothetical protein
MTHPISLINLSPRESITDALYRAIIGLDRNDIPSFNSTFAGEDVTMEIRPGNRVVKSLSTIRAQSLDQVGPMGTMHTVSSVRVDVKPGAYTASLTAYALAQHCLPGRGKEPD